MKVTTLDYVVKNVLVQMGDNSLNHYQSLLQYAIRGFRRLNLFATTTTKTVYLNMSPSKTVPLPTDYVKYTKIGMCCNGHVILLGLDDSICTGNKVNECGDPLPIVVNKLQQDASLSTDLFSFFFPFLDFFRNGQYIGGVYGLGGGMNSRGYYKIDTANNQIQFSSETPSLPILLEYISDGLSPDGSASIPIEAVECLIAFVHWQRLQFDRNANQYDKENAHQQYIIEFNALKHFNLSFSVAEYLASNRAQVYQSPKR